MKLYLSYEFFSYDRHDDMETRLDAPTMIGMLRQIVSLCIFAFRIKILNGNPCAGLIIGANVNMTYTDY